MVKHSTAYPGIVSSIPLTSTKITKRRYVLVLPKKNVPVYQCFTLGTLKNLVCHVWGRSSILHYGPLMDTNYLYAPTPNGQSPSASLNKGNTPMYAGKEWTAHRDITQISVTTAVCVQRRFIKEQTT